ncbi:trehalose-6-phosphate synthase, putative [Theileria equi strain WA]|uniref:Trehalose-6-phosphate synthase, putative n=1 Tax=Theileria equi strain WA TaxID=1537102 RepID=L1L9H0_THEEQ|nr:trehalose-6-phosphate synthase, putative [Theileria equi strain WA]EKX72062.1 trehalose-6-phosphate synthase, putative [Theileria equi strain WA]|eukprot:XP_004831514.1 trehalose-6-phosphate synthase, putative [Theileria equi strain WA]
MVYYTAVHFRCRAQLEYGQRVVVVGAHERLGNWDIKRSHSLVQSDTVEDVWNSLFPVYLPLKERMTYKYAVLNVKDEFMRWNDEMERYIEPTGNEMIIEDDDGYYRSECSTYSNDENKKTLMPSNVSDDAKADQKFKYESDPNKTVYFVTSRLPIQIYRKGDGEFGIRDSNTPLTAALWQLRNRYTSRMKFVGSCSVTLATEKDLDSPNFGGVGTPELRSRTRRSDSADGGAKRDSQHEQDNKIEFTEEEQEKIRQLLAEHDCIPVFIPKLDIKHSLKFCKTYMWNLFYNIGLWDIAEQKEFDWELWQSYLKVNKQYAYTAAQCISGNDSIWVHDYKLLMVPHFITRKCKTANIAMFMHALFPSYSLFASIAVREEILRSMLCSDLIGFHYFEFARQFLTSCKRILGLDHSFSAGGTIGIEYNGRQVMVRMSHAHIQPDLLMEKIGPGTPVPGLVREIKEKWPNRFIVASVDRDTILSGLILKFRAFKRFLQDYPSARGKILLVQHICTLDTLWEGRLDVLFKLKDLANSINAEFNTTHIILNRNITYEQKYALFMAADCFMDTSIRGGINLCAFEYILCRKGMPACAIVSEFTGFSKTLLSAVRVNPWHIERVMSALDTAMSLSLEDRMESCSRDVDYIEGNDTITWVEDLLKELSYARKKQDMFHLTWGFGRTYKTCSFSANFKLLDTDYLLKHFEHAQRRLIFLDCEGTLSSSLSDIYARSTRERKQQIKLHSAPLDVNLESIKELAADKRNVVVLISCRGRKIMDSWFGDIKNVGLCAEHGYNYKLPAITGDEWQHMQHSSSGEWKDAATQFLGEYVQRTPGSYLDVIGSAVIFQYHHSDTEFGAIQANELYPALSEVMTGFPVEVHRGKSHVEVKLKGINKGSALLHVVKKYSALYGDFDFVLCVGDDRSDEEMYKALNTLYTWVCNARPDLGKGPDEVHDQTTPVGHSESQYSIKPLDMHSDPHPQSQGNAKYISCTVGKRPSKAHYYLNDYLEVAELLSSMAKCSK